VAFEKLMNEQEETAVAEQPAPVERPQGGIIVEAGASHDPKKGIRGTPKPADAAF
jgi:hypothetical protein